MPAILKPSKPIHIPARPGSARRSWLERLALLSTSLGLNLNSQGSQAQGREHRQDEYPGQYKKPLFEPVKLGQTLSFPRDHGAHPNYKTEWWYVTGFLSPRLGEAESLGFQVTFFRSATGAGIDNPSRFAPKQLLFAHAALALKSQGKLIHQQSALRSGFQRLTTLSEADTDVRSLDWQIKREGPLLGGSTYKISVTTPRFLLDLSLTAPTRPALQGEQGFSRKGPSPNQASHYYSRPQLQVEGRVFLTHSLAEKTLPSSTGIKKSPARGEQDYVGRAWLDHEWSNEVLDESAAGWDWVGLNFDNGESLMAFQIRPKIAGQAVWCEARSFNRQGEADFVIPPQDQVSARRRVLSFKPKKFWRSLRSNALYPVELEIELLPPDSTVKRTLFLQAMMDDQEVDARASTGGFYWEGLVYVYEQQRKIGQGYLELTGYAAPMRL
jgi:predicted secreted hydrolase